MNHITESEERMPRRPGRRCRLDSFKAPSCPVNASSTEYSDDLGWFERYGGFILREIHGDENCGTDLGVNEAMKQRIRENLKPPSPPRTSPYDHFISYSGSVQKIPPFPLEGDYEEAGSISKALMREAKRDRSLVHKAVSAYAHGARISDKLLVLTTTDHAPFGRPLIDLVQHLDLEWLRWRLVAFKTGEVHPRFIPAIWREALRLPSNTRVHPVTAKNKANSENYANQIAVEVIKQRGSLKEVSSSFYSVMLFANVVEMWHLD